MIEIDRLTKRFGSTLAVDDIVWGRGSILAVAVLHATFNASADLVDSDHDWIRYAVTLAFGLLVLLAPGLRRGNAGTAVLR